MSNLQCNKSASKYIRYLGKNSVPFINIELNSKEINTILNDILDQIEKDILKKEFPSFDEAKKSIPNDSNKLISLIKMYNVYLTECKDSSFTSVLKSQMCRGYKILCKTYHLLHIWSLLVLNCLFFQEPITRITNENLAKAIIDINQGNSCIDKLQTKNNLRLAKYLLNNAYELRKNFKHYCGKNIDKKHYEFIKKVERTIKKINKQINHL
jgi:hypothetical protein